MNPVNCHNLPTFKGFVRYAAENPPVKCPANEQERLQNAYALGLGSGMDLMSKISSAAGAAIITVGALTGAIMPKRTINRIRSLAGAGENLIAKETSKTFKLRGKAALIGGLIGAATATITGFVLKTAMPALLPENKTDIEEN